MNKITAYGCSFNVLTRLFLSRYGSAIACGYSRGDARLWEPMARIVLDATYEGTLWATALELDAARKEAQECSSSPKLPKAGGLQSIPESDSGDEENPDTNTQNPIPPGKGRAVLTFLGGGVFANDPDWILCAIARACVKLAHLYVLVSCFAMSAANIVRYLTGLCVFVRKNSDIRVTVCHFGSIKSSYKHDLQDKIDALRRQERRQRQRQTPVQKTNETSRPAVGDQSKKDRAAEAHTVTEPHKRKAPHTPPTQDPQASGGGGSGIIDKDNTKDEPEVQESQDSAESSLEKYF